MASKFGPAAFSQADIMRRFRLLERDVTQLRTGRSLEAASIGAGGLRVIGGQILIQNEAGDTTMTLATDGLTLEGFIQILGGAGLTVQDGGSIVAEYPSGNRGILFGTLFSQITGENSGHGLLVRADGPQLSDTLNIFRAKTEIDGSSSVFVGSSTSGPDVFSTLSGAAGLNTDDGPITIAPSAQVFGLSLTNTTGTANMIIGADGGPGTVSQVQRVTSSAAFKVDVEDLKVNTEEVMNLRPRTWRDRGEVEKDPDTDRWYVGLVAEEVDEAGLTEFVDYDEEGKPVAVAYDRLSIALLEVVRQLSARVDALDGGAKTFQRSAGRKPRRMAKPGQGLLTPVVPATPHRTKAETPVTPTKVQHWSEVGG